MELNGFVRNLDGGRTWTRHRMGFRPDENSYLKIWNSGETWTQSSIHQVNDPITISPANPDLVLVHIFQRLEAINERAPGSAGDHRHAQSHQEDRVRALGPEHCVRGNERLCPLPQ